MVFVPKTAQDGQLVCTNVGSFTRKVRGLHYVRAHCRSHSDLLLRRGLHAPHAHAVAVPLLTHPCFKAVPAPQYSANVAAPKGCLEVSAENPGYSPKNAAQKLKSIEAEFPESPAPLNSGIQLNLHLGPLII